MRTRFNRACFLLLGMSGIVWLGVISIGSYQTTKSAFDKIEPGMTPEDVDNILGFGPFMISGGSTNVDAMWIMPTGEHVIVYFGAGHVSEKKYAESTLPLHEQLWGN